MIHIFHSYPMWKFPLKHAIFKHLEVEYRHSVELQNFHLNFIPNKRYEEQLSLIFYFGENVAIDGISKNGVKVNCNCHKFDSNKKDKSYQIMSLKKKTLN